MSSISAIGLLFLVDWLHSSAAYKAVPCSHPAAVQNCEVAQFAILLFDVKQKASSQDTLMASPVEIQE